MTPYLPIAVIDSGGLARLTEGPVKVYVILCRYAKAKTLHAWPSLATVAHLAGISDRAVRKALRVLERAGLIVTRRGIGRSHTSVYKLVENPDPPNPVSEVEKGNHRSGLLGGKGEQGFRVSEAEKGNRGSGFLSGKGEPRFPQKIV
jgi:hypothetical protein